MFIVLAVALAVFITAGSLEAFEWLTHASQRWEGLQADETVFLLIALCAGLAWFSWRRWRHAVAETAEREAAQSEVSRLLEQNRALLQNLLAVQERERLEIGRELHDQLGQVVTALRVELASMERNLDAGLTAACRAGIRSAEALSEATHSEIRQLLRRMRPWGLDELGLATVLETHTTRWSQQTGIGCALHIRSEAAETLAALPETLRLTLFRAVQEGLTNVARHARGARHVEIALVMDHFGTGVPQQNNSPECTTLALTVQDDGEGYAPEPEREGLGLLGMQERARIAGGSVTYGPVADGFRVRMTLPVLNRNDRKPD